MLRCLAFGCCFSKCNFTVTKTQNQLCFHSCSLPFAWHRVYGTVLNGHSVTLTEHQTFEPLSVYEGICLSSFTGCKHRLHSPINDHYKPNDSSGWPGKIKMGITSRQIRYFYLCIETYKFMECWYWIVQRIDCSWTSTSRTWLSQLNSNLWCIF